MNIGIIGAGHIGGNAARLFAAAGHHVMVSFSRNTSTLQALAAGIGPNASVGTPAEAVAFGEVVLFSVPWGAVDDALSQAGSLAGKIVIDTTNQFGRSGLEAPPDGQTAAQFNARRMAGARYTKSFNTLTAGFQASTAGRSGPDRVVQWLCGDDQEAKDVVSGLISDAGFVAVDIGGLNNASVMEAPRRMGAVYGEEYHLADAEAVVEAVRDGQPIPPTPSYL
jgi:predicted dinucleotide-binding enzyme